MSSRDRLAWSSGRRGREQRARLDGRLLHAVVAEQESLLGERERLALVELAGCGSGQSRLQPWERIPGCDSLPERPPRP